MTINLDSGDNDNASGGVLWRQCCCVYGRDTDNSNRDDHDYNSAGCGGGGTDGEYSGCGDNAVGGSNSAGRGTSPADVDDDVYHDAFVINHCRLFCNESISSINTLALARAGILLVAMFVGFFLWTKYLKNRWIDSDEIFSPVTDTQ